MLPFFYDPDVLSQVTCQLKPEAAKHCLQVLRMVVGDKLTLLDGAGNLFEAEIVSLPKKACIVQVLSVRFVPPPERKIGIAISPIKNVSRFEWFLEKAAELGVTDIFPIACHRTYKEHLRHERLSNILASAMVQSRQAWLTKLHPLCPFEVFAETEWDGTKLLAHCEDGNKAPICTYWPGNVLAAIGPEGDFTSAEIQLALRHGFRPVSLGGTRLRTETAGIAAAASLALVPKAVEQGG